MFTTVVGQLDNHSFENLKRKAEKDYKKIIAIQCPALNTNILFSSDGFHHLRYDNSRKERSKKVQKNKFMFLNEAVDIMNCTEASFGVLKQF